MNKTMTVVFEPVAQNTVIRPMAQAISLARGGEDVSYIDTADKKEKIACLENSRWLNLRTNVNGRWVPLEADLVAFKANQGISIRMRILVNDVTVNVTRNTTVDQAMKQFRRKLAAQERLTTLPSMSRQREG